MAAQSRPKETPAPALQPRRGVDQWSLIGAAILVVVTIAAYSRTFSVPLLFDDVGAIVNNPSIRHGSTAFWPRLDSTVSGRPVLNLSLAVNYAISGTAVWSYHVVNLAIHILAGLTLFGILRRALVPRAPAGAAPMAFFAALWWTLHPLQTESVTYIVQRAESLMGLFYLLTLYCFIRGTQAEARSRVRWFSLSVASCLLGMGTKEVMVSAPLFVFFYDRTFVSGSFGQAWQRHGKMYFALGATWLVLPFLVLSTHGRAGTSGFESGVSWWSYALTQFPAILHYLKLSLWPHPLVFDYGTQWVTGLGAVLLSAVIVTGLTVAAAWIFFRQGFGERCLGFGGLWFLAILAPTSLIPGNRQTSAEHRMYLALIPIMVLLAIGIYRWLGRAALPVCAALAAVLFAITWLRNEDYHSALSIWSRTVADCPGNASARINLGCELQNLPGGVPAAIEQFQAALQLKPDYAEAHNDLGSVLDAEGRSGEALAELETALRLKPDYAEAHNNLGNALAKQPGRLNDALFQYQEALRLKPDDVEAHNNLANLLEKLPGHVNDAIAEYEEALRLDPGFARARNNLGNALATIPGRLNYAIAEFEEALREAPDYAEADYNLGNVLNAAGRPLDAIPRYEAALRLKPDYVDAHINLANTLDSLGRSGEAIAEYQAALRLRPDYAVIHFNFAVALLNSPGHVDEAVEQLEATLRLQPGNDAARQLLARIRAARP
jgi:tetratricopeptide (TPR) repeat protein